MNLKELYETARKDKNYSRKLGIRIISNLILIPFALYFFLAILVGHKNVNIFNIQLLFVYFAVIIFYYCEYKLYNLNTLVRIVTNFTAFFAFSFYILGYPFADITISFVGKLALCSFAFSVFVVLIMTRFILWLYNLPSKKSSKQ